MRYNKERLRRVFLVDGTKQNVLTTFNIELCVIAIQNELPAHVVKMLKLLNTTELWDCFIALTFDAHSRFVLRFVPCLYVLSTIYVLFAFIPIGNYFIFYFIV